MSVRASASLPFELLRRHVLERPEDRALLRQTLLRRKRRQALLARGGRHRLRQAEVQQLHARLRQHHVAGLQVPMHDPLPVRLVQRVGDLRRRSAASARAAAAPSPAAPTASRPRALHDEVLGLALAADVVERADVRMRELRDRLRLPLEPLPRLPATPTCATAAPSPPPSAPAACPAPCRPPPSRPRRSAPGSRRDRASFRRRASLRRGEPETTPMLAIVSPFFMEGTAQM